MIWKTFQFFSKSFSLIFKIIGKAISMNNENEINLAPNQITKLRLMDDGGNAYPLNEMIYSPGIQLNYEINLAENQKEVLNRHDMWRWFNFIPLQYQRNIVTLGEGKTPLIRVQALEGLLNGAKLFCKNECDNPTGTFKDREASYVISKAKEMNIKKIVFHSTGNTGRAYSVYASSCGIESFFFLPLSCLDKCDGKMIADNIHIIAIDGHFNQVSRIAKTFAKKNGITVLAPLHEKIEGKATIAYEQYEELPDATIFAQTIAGGYGIIGFNLGHTRLKKLGVTSADYVVPRIVAIQAGDSCTIEKGIRVGKENLSEFDLILPSNPFETTLQSTNPLGTFAQVKECLDKTNGFITSASTEEVLKIKTIFEKAMKANNISISFDNEKSPFISFAGLIKLAKEDKITSRDVIYLVITGNGRGEKPSLGPEAILKPTEAGYIIETTSHYLEKML